MYQFLPVYSPFLLPLFLYVFYRYSIYGQIKHKYNQLQDLRSLVKTRYKNPLTITKVCISLILKSWWYEFLQYINNTITRIDKKSILLTYVLNNKIYRMIIRPQKGPPNILMVVDNNFNDVTENILSYYGPQHDWHNRSFTPACLGYEKLTFELSDTTSKTFEKMEKIII